MHSSRKSKFYQLSSSNSCKSDRKSSTLKILLSTILSTPKTWTLASGLVKAKMEFWTLSAIYKILSQGRARVLVMLWFYKKVAKEVTIEWSHELHLAANKRINAMEKGNISVQSQDVGELVSEFGSWKGPLCEIVVYGFIDPK